MDRITKWTVVVVLLPLFAFGVMAGIVGCVPQDGAAAMPIHRQYFPTSTGLRDATFPGYREQGISFQAIEGESGTMGYLAEQQVSARSGMFKVTVILDLDRSVKLAYASQYVGERGREVCSERFAQQFRGKASNDPIRVGEDIDAVTGATVSSRTMATSVRRIVHLARQESTR